MARVSCPFCNAAYDAADTGPAACPRCGETLPGRGALPAAPLMPADRGRPPGRRGWVIPLAVAALVVGVLVGAYALGTRRPAASVAEPGETIGVPHRLRGLDFLPAESNVVFVVRPVVVTRQAAEAKQSPADVLTQLGVPASVLAGLGQAGVTLDQIHHVAVGAYLPDADLGELRLAVALVLRAPVPDEPKFLAALKARPSPPHHAAEFAGLPLKLSKVDDRVWLFGWSDRDVAAAGAGVSERMRDAIAGTTDASAAAFAVTDSADWGAKKSVGLLLTLGGKADWQPGVARVRAVAAGLTLTNPPTLRVLAKAATPAAREELRDAFERQPGTTGETGEWLFLDAPANRAGGLAALRAVFAAPE